MPACSIKELLFATTPRSILQSDQEVITLLTSLAPQLQTAGIHAVRAKHPCIANMQEINLFRMIRTAQVPAALSAQT